MSMQWEHEQGRTAEAKGKAQKTRVAMACAALVLVPACSTALPKPNLSQAVVATAQPPAELGEKWGAENEAQTNEITSTVMRMLADRTQGDSFMRRDAHPKHHGCVTAFVRIDSSSLPRALQVGVFAPDSQAEYPAWIRFSNGNPDATKPDIDKDIRGMAVKLMNVEGTTSGSQDFVMLTSKEFFARDADDYLDLHRALSGSGLLLAWHFATHVQDLQVLLRGRVRAGNPLQLEYFSSVPYKLGPRSMKFKARPCLADPIVDEIPADPPANYLAQRLVDTLKARDACYELLVQPNMDPAVNAVEDASRAWDEGKSPYVKVATITIPRQGNIDSPGQTNACENLSFDPWRGRPETRPLGQINRMRLAIYPAVARLRHDYNHVPAVEPRSHDICGVETASLCRAPKH